jgi:hypothetical protein
MPSCKSLAICVHPPERLFRIRALLMVEAGRAVLGLGSAKAPFDDFNLQGELVFGQPAAGGSDGCC